VRSRALPPWRGWGAIVVLPAAVLLLHPPGWPRWSFMWLLAGAVFAGCKWLTWRRTPTPPLPWWRHAGYLLAWPGLDAGAFLAPGGLPERERPTLRELRFAAAKALLGVVLFWGLGRLVPERWGILAGWVGIVGLAFLLHFGSFHLLSCAWRSAGVAARPLMNHPWASVSVAEFWGKRWNTAFRDLTYRFLFRPLTGRLGPRPAIAVGFVFSGLVHDLVISVPAGGGYGGPTLFFTIQAVALLGERSRAGRALGLGRGWRGRLSTLLVVALPAYGLFHPPFVRRIIAPFMRALGAA
jgi:hypothetical protein